MRPSKWPWTLVAIAIALSFVSGTFMAIDASQSTIVEAETASVPVDFIGTSISPEAVDSPGTITGNIDWLLHGPDEIQAIQACQVITHAFVMDSLGNYCPYYPGGYYPIMFFSDENDRILDSYGINGTVPDKGGIALPKQMADDMGLSVGSLISLYFVAVDSVFDPGTNITYWYREELYVPFTVSQIWTQEGFKDETTFSPGGSVQYQNLDQRSVVIREFVNPAALNIEDLYPIVGDFTPMLRERFVYEESETLYFFWIPREKYIEFTDITGSIESLDALYGRLNDRCSSFDISLMRSELVHAISVGELGGTSGYRVYYLGLSLPILVLGFYVTSVGASISTDLRNDELQSAATRGFRRRAIIGCLTKESIIVGVAAGVIGYLIGMLVSDMMLSSIVVSLGWYNDVEVSDSSFVFTWFTLLATIGLGVFAVVFTTFFAAVKATTPLRTAPSELEALHILPIKEVILIGLSLISIIGVLSGGKYVGAHGLDPYVGSLDALLSSIVIVLFPAMPLMLTIGLVSLLTRRPIAVQGRLAGLLSKDADRVSVPLGPMAARCDKRVRRLSVIGALVVALVIFVSVSMNTVVMTQKDSARLSVGAEVRVSAEIVGGWWQGDSWYPDASFPTEANFSAISGVSHCALYQMFMATAMGNQYSWTTTVNPQSYLDSAHPTTKDANGDPEAVLSLLESSSNAIVSESYASENGVDEGEAFTMQFMGYVVGSNDSVDFTLNLVAAHIFNDLPVLTDIVIGYSAVSSIPKYTYDHIGSDGGVLIDADDGADQEAIAAQAAQIFIAAGLYSDYKYFLEKELSDIDKSPDQGGLFDFLVAETWTSALVVMVGVAMGSYSTARFVMSGSHRASMAREQLRKVRSMLASESFGLAVVGASVGVFVGILTSYLFGMMWSPYDFPRPTLGADFTVMVFLIAAVVAVGIVLLAVASSLVGSSRESIESSSCGREAPPGPRQST